MLGECERIVTNAQNTADRLQRFNGMASRARCIIRRRLPVGFAEAPMATTCWSSSRLEPLKRVELAIRAMAHVACAAST